MIAEDVVAERHHARHQLLAAALLRAIGRDAVEGDPDVSGVGGIEQSHALVDEDAGFGGGDFHRIVVAQQRLEPVGIDHADRELTGILDRGRGVGAGVLVVEQQPVDELRVCRVGHEQCSRDGAQGGYFRETHGDASARELRALSAQVIARSRCDNWNCLETAVENAKGVLAAHPEGRDACVRRGTAQLFGGGRLGCAGAVADTALAAGLEVADPVQLAEYGQRLALAGAADEGLQRPSTTAFSVRKVAPDPTIASACATD